MNWRNVMVVLLALVVGLGVLIKIATRGPIAPEHQVFINGDILTMDAGNRVVEAISVRRDRIEAVGDTDEIMALVDDHTEVVDLRGRTLLPGFIDAHGHFPYSGFSALAASLYSPPVGEIETIAQLQAELGRWVENTEPGEWVLYSTPEPGGAEYVAICLPAFSPETVHRDEQA